MASRKGTASFSSAKSPEGKLGQWLWLTSDSVKRHYKHVYVKNSQLFGLRTSRNPQKHQISHYRYAWGEPKSLTSVDLWKVKMQCQKSDVVICCPKSCVISPFLSTAASYVAENTISLKNRSEAAPLVTSLLCDLSWPGQILLPKVAQRMPHQLCKLSARSAQWFGGDFREAHGGAESIRLHGRYLNIFGVCDFLKITFHKYLEKMQLVQVYHMPVNETVAIQSLCCRFLGCQKRFFCDFWAFFGDALSWNFKIFKNEYPNLE